MPLTRGKPRKTRGKETHIITFDELGLPPEILISLSEMGFTNPTPVQQEIILPIIEGRDCLAQAPTGTGKTSAFGIPLIAGVKADCPFIQALVLCPTRELVQQIDAEFRRIAAHSEGVKIVSIYGGQNFDRQLALLRKRPQIVVGTTGRVLDHLRRHTLKLENCRHVVLDEADEMLKMGFREDIDAIFSQLVNRTQTLLFSATMPKEILALSNSYQTEAVHIKTTCDGSDLPDIKQYLLNFRADNRYAALRALISKYDYTSVLVFCNTKRRVDELNRTLNEDYYLSMALHGDLLQRERDKVMKAFRQKAINILVASDIAARGIDVQNIQAIINYDVPLSGEYYVHRIGRTARADKDGSAYTFALAKDKGLVSECERAAGTTMQLLELGELTAPVKARKGAKETVRMFFNVGTVDGLTEEKWTAYASNMASVPAENISCVKLLDRFGFMEVMPRNVEALLKLNGEICFKRKLGVEVADGEVSAENAKNGRNGTSRSGGRSASNATGSRKANDKDNGAKRNAGGKAKTDGRGETGKSNAYGRVKSKDYKKTDGTVRSPEVGDTKKPRATEQGFSRGKTQSETERRKSVQGKRNEGQFDGVKAAPRTDRKPRSTGANNGRNGEKRGGSFAPSGKGNVRKKR